VYNFGWLLWWLVMLYFDGLVYYLFMLGLDVLLDEWCIGYVMMLVCYYELGLIVLVLVKCNIVLDVVLLVDGVSVV